MSIRKRVFKYTDFPIWIRAIVVGALLWVLMVLALGQLPSVMVYKFDQYIDQIITPGVFIVFIAVWAGIYLLLVTRRQRGLERRLKDLEPRS